MASQTEILHQNYNEPHLTAMSQLKMITFILRLAWDDPACMRWIAQLFKRIVCPNLKCITIRFLSMHGDDTRIGRKFVNLFGVNFKSVFGKSAHSRRDIFGGARPIFRLVLFGISDISIIVEQMTTLFPRLARSGRLEVLEGGIYTG